MQTSEPTAIAKPIILLICSLFGSLFIGRNSLSPLVAFAVLLFEEFVNKLSVVVFLGIRTTSPNFSSQITFLSISSLSEAKLQQLVICRPSFANYGQIWRHKSLNPKK